MADVEKVEKDDHRARHKVTLEPGERVSLCRCQKSANYPFCDGSHKKLDDLVGPVLVEAKSNNTENLNS